VINEPAGSPFLVARQGLAAPESPAFAHRRSEVAGKRPGLTGPLLAASLPRTKQFSKQFSFTTKPFWFPDAIVLKPMQEQSVVKDR
jgi:hypothetical protein